MAIMVSFPITNLVKQSSFWDPDSRSVIPKIANIWNQQVYYLVHKPNIEPSSDSDKSSSHTHTQYFSYYSPNFPYVSEEISFPSFFSIKIYEFLLSSSCAIKL
jgi:hypothetical protein